MDQEKIGKFILQLRKKNKMTQLELAERLNVTSQAVSKWENGRGIPDIELLKKISEEFNVDINTILEGETIKKKNKLLILISSYSVLALVVFLIVLAIVNNNQTYSLSPITTGSELFQIDGVAAYHEDKKSVHITSLEVTSETTDKYVMKECSLYEKEKDTTVKVTDCNEIKVYDSYKEEQAAPLEQLLENTEFHKTNYISICEDLEKANLFIVLKMFDENNKVINYEIPLNFNYTCAN